MIDLVCAGKSAKLLILLWCPGPDSNRHSLRNRILNPATRSNIHRAKVAIMSASKSRKQHSKPLWGAYDAETLFDALLQGEMMGNFTWDSAEFEDYVARLLIACFESKVRKNRICDPSDRLNDERMMWVRNVGPYIPGKSRILLSESLFSPESTAFDTLNDSLPEFGVVAWPPTEKTSAAVQGAYIDMQSIRRVSQLGKNWRATAAGAHYETFAITAGGDGVRGFRLFFTVTKDGGIRICEDKGAESTEWAGSDVAMMRVSYALNVMADQKFCWTITALEKSAKARLGCMPEEIKSLLYARSLPMSETGRKRPILHLVEAHKRRIRNGTEIDVTPFLRGQQVVEFGGTTFKVDPPQSIRTDLSDKSDRYYA